MKAGSRWCSTVDTTEVVVVKSPAEPVTLECGGAPMVPQGEAPSGGNGTVDPAHAGGTLLGKRYVDDGDLGLEVLCTKAGPGSLSVGGRPLVQKEAKPLPSSD